MEKTVEYTAPLKVVDLTKEVTEKSTELGFKNVVEFLTDSKYIAYNTIESEYAIDNKVENGKYGPRPMYIQYLGFIIEHKIEDLDKVKEVAIEKMTKLYSFLLDEKAIQKRLCGPIMMELSDFGYASEEGKIIQKPLVEKGKKRNCFMMYIMPNFEFGGYKWEEGRDKLNALLNTNPDFKEIKAHSEGELPIYTIYL